MSNAAAEDSAPSIAIDVGGGSAVSLPSDVRTDREWAMKRDWTDADFQDGAENNKQLLQEFEDVLVDRMKQSCTRALGAGTLPSLERSNGAANVLARVLEPAVAQCGRPHEHVKEAVLNDPQVLGSSLDMVGAYLKNYEVDKAAAVIETIMDACRNRGGLWYLKALNFLATVRMKQSRSAEALEVLQMTEAYAKEKLTGDEMDEAWEFWETVYRNYGWILSSLDRECDAIEYIQRAIDVKEQVGRPVSWFDLWDLGRMKATSALKRSEPKSIQESQTLVTKALWLHRDAEPKDLVMRAKIWHSVGECSFALGYLDDGEMPSSASANPNGVARSAAAKKHFGKALKCFKESHKIFKKTEGQYNPLTGTESQAVAWTLLKLGDDEEAKGNLLDALESTARQQSGWGDGNRLEHQSPALVQAMLTVDRILEAHRRTDDRQGLTCYFDAIDRLCENVVGRIRLSKERVDSAVYEKLVSSCSMVMVASGSDDGSHRSQELLRKFMWDQPQTAQAKLCNEMLRSINDGSAPSDGRSAGASGPGVRAFLDALAHQQR